MLGKSYTIQVETKAKQYAYLFFGWLTLLTSNSENDK